MILGPGELFSIASAVCWSVALIYFKLAGESVGPSALNFFKNLLGFPLIGLTAAALGVPLFDDLSGTTLGLLGVSGILGMSVADSLMFASLNRLGAGWTAVVSATWSPIMIGVTWLLYGVPLTWPVAAGSVLIAGAILVAREEPGEGSRSRRDILVGLGLGMLGQAVMAVAVAMLKYPTLGLPALLTTREALFVTFWRVGAGALTLFVWLMLTARGRAELRTLRPSPTWRLMVPGSLFGSWLAIMAWVAGMKYVEGSLVRAAILNQTTVIWLPILGALFLAEPIRPRKAAAIGLAFSGAVVIVLSR